MSDVPLGEDEVLIDDFDSMLDGVNLRGDLRPRGVRPGEASSGRTPLVRVTAVLERTCVYLDREGDRRLVSKKNLWVEVDTLPIRRRGVG